MLLNVNSIFECNCCRSASVVDLVVAIFSALLLFVIASYVFNHMFACAIRILFVRWLYLCMVRFHAISEYLVIVRNGSNFLCYCHSTCVWRRFGVVGDHGFPVSIAVPKVLDLHLWIFVLGWFCTCVLSMVVKCGRRFVYFDYFVDCTFAKRVVWPFVVEIAHCICVASFVFIVRGVFGGGVHLVL